jgi:tetratricopeptide (TPR) repeat protein
MLTVIITKQISPNHQIYKGKDGYYFKDGNGFQAISLWNERHASPGKLPGPDGTQGLFETQLLKICSAPLANGGEKGIRKMLIGQTAIELQALENKDYFAKEYHDLILKFVANIRQRGKNMADEVDFWKEIVRECTEAKGKMTFLRDIPSSPKSDMLPAFIFDVGSILGAPVEIVLKQDSIGVRTKNYYFDNSDMEKTRTRLLGANEQSAIISTSDAARIKSHLHMLAGFESMKSGDFSGAFKHYSNAIATDDTYANASNAAGNALQALKMHAEAIEYYEEAARLADDPVLKSRYYYNLAGARMLAGGVENSLEAISDCGNAIELDGRFAEAYVLRSSLHRAQSDLKAALDDCDEAVRIAPHLPAAYNERFIVNDLLGMYTADIREYERLSGKQASGAEESNA